MLCTVLAMFVAPAAAGQWEVTASTGSYAEFDDNPRLQDEGADAVYGVVANLGIDLRRRTERSTLSLVPRVVVRRYTGDYALDSDDVFLNADQRFEGERGEYSLGASFARDGTLTSEFVATGSVSENTPRETIGLSAGASRTLDERSLLHGSAAYQNVQYEDGLRYGLLDYNYWSGLLYYQRSIDERTSFNVLSRVALLKVPLSGAESREFTPGLGLTRRWSDRWTTSFDVGPTFSEINGRSNGINTSFRLNLAGTWERSSLRVDAERLLSPAAGQGVLESRDRVAANLSYGLTEQLRATATAAVDYYSSADDPRNRGGRYRSYSRAGVGLVWRAAQQWSLNARYEFSHLEDDTNASSHQLVAGFNWSGPPRPLSR
jgi:hypothetical protein